MELLSSTKLTHAGKSRSLYDVFDEDKSIAWYQKSLDIDRLDLKRERRPLWRAAVAVAVRLPEVGVASVNVGCVQARIQSIARMLAVLVKIQSPCHAERAHDQDSIACMARELVRDKLR